MSTPRAELLLHPVRIRIMQLAASAPDLTARQLADALPDVPPATLYRHLGRLVEAGLLTVIEERPVRGATEKVYALPDGDPLQVLPHREDASAEEHFRAFLGFQGAQYGEASALAIVSLVPSIVLGVLAQRHLVRGLTLGAVRG